MTRPNPTDLARRMLAAAKEATPGEWRADLDIDTSSKPMKTAHTVYLRDARQHLGDKTYGGREFRAEDAEYIALCSPANIEVLAEAYLGMTADTNLAIHIAEDLQSRIDRALELLPGCKMDTEKGEWGDNEEAVSAVCAALTGEDQ